MTKEKIQLFTLRITNANKTGMIAILYDMGIEYLNDAITALDNCEYDSFYDEIHKFRGVLRELMNSVNNESEVGRIFLSIYIFAGKEITHGMINKEKAPIENVLSIFTTMSKAYNKAASMDSSGPVMEHAEAVYSGFTYNKNSMAESVQSHDANRGFLA